MTAQLELPHSMTSLIEPDRMTIGSLFSGYGGLDFAVEEVTGGKTIWVSDVDPGACKILAERFPDAPNIGDITAVDWSEVEPVDVICGGSPCQDVSAAGRRAGMNEGTRSNLWVAMREAIAIIRPQLVIWENVRGALSASAGSASDVEPGEGSLGDGHNGPLLRALGRVLGDLASLGYDAEWTTVPASAVGAPHRRERVFVVAWPAENPVRSGIGRRAAQSVNGKAQRADTPAHRADARLDPSGTSAGVDLLPTPCAQPSGNTPENHLRKKPGRERVTDLSILVENDLLETGGKLLPTPSAALSTMGGGRDPEERRSGNHSVTLKDAIEGGPGMPSPLTPTEGRLDRFGPYAPVIDLWERKLGRPAPDPTEPGRTRPRLSARFVEFMMGVPDGWVTDTDTTRNQQLKALGNGVVPAQAVFAVSWLLERSEQGRAAA